jgi:hypothetical protein
LKRALRFNTRSRRYPFLQNATSPRGREDFFVADEAFRSRFPPFCIGAGLSRPPVPQETFPEQERLRSPRCQFRAEQECNQATICIDFLTGFAG